MSEAWANLKRGARELQLLSSDVAPLQQAAQDWKQLVTAPKTLGKEVKVEAWYLASHFFLTWHDWHLLRSRFQQYFGVREEDLPEKWVALDTHAEEFAVELLSQPGLLSALASDWRQPDATVRLEEAREPDLRATLHALIQAHRRYALLHWANDHAFQQRPRDSQRGILSQLEGCFKVVIDANRAMFHGLQRWLPHLSENLLFHLRSYRRATLLTSWLYFPTAPPDRRADFIHERLLALQQREELLRRRELATRRGRGRPGSPVPQSATADVGPVLGTETLIADWHLDFSLRFPCSALMYLLLELPMQPTIERYLREFDRQPELQSEASKVLERISRAITEMGYDEFATDVTDEQFRGGPESVLGTDGSALVPSARTAKGAKLLVAVSKGTKTKLGFVNVMREVRKHLIARDETRAVIVLTDHWLPNMLDEHIWDLQAHHMRGARFLFLLAGTPNRSVSPVAVNLEMTA